MTLPDALIAQAHAYPKEKRMTESYTFLRCRQRQDEHPWVCVASDCDEALPPERPGQECPRCGSDMIRSPYSRVINRELV